ncbi:MULTISPECIES: hypothetical protein [unclassified Microbacterium]|uniref:hypothetical protein n=1 Tax=unclassified Microbacterium TaxID=2609290 RepID=UPI00300F9DDD
MTAWTGSFLAGIEAERALGEAAAVLRCALEDAESAGGELRGLTAETAWHSEGISALGERVATLAADLSDATVAARTAASELGIG